MDKAKLVEFIKKCLAEDMGKEYSSDEIMTLGKEALNVALGSLTAEPGVIAENLQHLEWSGVSGHHRAIINAAVVMLSRPPTPPAASRVPGGCEWAYDDDGYKWEADCGTVWHFIDDGPNENGLKFCPGCGKPVVLAAAPSKEDA